MIRVPLYLPQTCTLARVVTLFQQGEVAFAVVGKDANSAQMLRDHADQVHLATCVQNMPETKDPGVIEVVGILTHHNILNRILMTEIIDERQRAALRNISNRSFDDALS